MCQPNYFEAGKPGWGWLLFAKTRSFLKEVCLDCIPSLTLTKEYSQTNWSQCKSLPSKTWHIELMVRISSDCLGTLLLCFIGPGHQWEMNSTNQSDVYTVTGHRNLHILKSERLTSEKPWIVDLNFFLTCLVFLVTCLLTRDNFQKIHTGTKMWPQKLFMLPG